MSFNFRNLVLLALLCGIISSLSISPQAHRMYNRHMIDMHQTARRYISHEQSTDGAQAFVDKIQGSINKIVGSIFKGVPSIVETKNIQSFSFPKTTCQSLTQQQKNSTLEKVKSARQNITDFKSGFNAQNNKKVLMDAQNSQKYLSLIEYLLTSKCRDIQNLFIGPSPYQTNINTPKPWILGGITLGDLVKTYIKRANDFDNMTNCGTQTPFWTGEKCIDCKDPTPIFNIATGQCTKCPDGTVYDATTKTCKAGQGKKPNPVAAPLTALVPKGAPQGALNTYLSTGAQICPESTPQVKNNECIKCPQDKPYFNIITKECLAGDPIATNVPVQNPKLKMNDDSTSADWDKYVEDNKNKPLCTEPSPFWDGQKCIPCPELFNIITLKCDVCQPGLKLNPDSHKCEPAAPLQPHLIDLFNAIF